MTQYGKPSMKRATARGRQVLLLLATLWMASAQAVQVNVSAQYRGGVDFSHTTAPAGFCARWPGQCHAGPTVDLPVAYERLLLTDSDDVRKGHYLKAPPRRRVTVSNERSGESHVLDFEIVALSQQVEGDANASLPGRAVGGGCSLAGRQGGSTQVQYLWHINAPAQPAACHAAPEQGDGNTPQSIRVGELGIAYRLITPSPLKMKPGIYRGRLDYSLGSGGDFDLGEGITALSSDRISIAFELDVVHAFAVEFAPGSERVVLEPPGGWNAWLNRPAPGLFRDVSLRIWSSGPFTVHTRCQYPVAGQCGIRNTHNGHEVPVALALTLPGGVQHSGQAVTRVALPTDQGRALVLESLQPMINQGGMLHFAVGKEHVGEMSRYPGSPYEGDMTVIFDAGL